MLKRIVRGLGVLGMAFFATACLHPFAHLQTTPAWHSTSSTLNRVAVLPFSEGRAVAHDQDTGARVTRYMAEALAARGISIIAGSDVELALGEDVVAESPAVLGNRLAQRWGVDSILLGEVQHYEALQGSAVGAQKAARVGFRVTLYRVQDGAKLLDAVFDERQVAVSENLLVSTRYPSMGSRWLSAEELARWGSKEVAKALVKLRKGRAK